ncbi:type IV conjugative transfer system protein TraL [Thiorhodococcus minor]|uniref:Type IV conjugative transfer system protein TraL n=1 Tax=Thiorhodococcus minor TaxID=57489 RepID=A0A6M0JS29_9GAMM|nr:type IV conjugative transfer system protein TraL [Thiorhodococcus minor]NEV60330.1 type IV conjugative transfer system protein TraL [Thiorhodococcus minor]
MATLELPRHVDDPPNLLLWRIDDLVPFFLMLVIGILINQTTLFILLGLLVTRGYGRFRESRADGFALHALYWSGLMPLRHRTTPNPYSRCYLP